MFVQPPDNERQLLLNIAGGNEQSYGELFTHYYKSVSSFVSGYMVSPELSEDISQEIFLAIWETRDRLSQVESFRSYLFTVARNHTLNMLKKAARSEAGMGEIIRQYQQVRSSTEDEILTHEYQRFLDNVITSLSPRTREVFRMCRDQARSYEEVASELGISRNAVKKHMVIAMKTLKDRVQKELGIPLSLLLTILR